MQKTEIVSPNLTIYSNHIQRPTCKRRNSENDGNGIEETPKPQTQV